MSDEKPFIVVRNYNGVAFRQIGTDKYPLPEVDIYRDMFTRGTLDDHIHYGCPTDHGFDLMPSGRCWKAKAEDVKPGDRYMSFGCGYIQRVVESTETKCNCEWGSHAVDPVTREPLHYPVTLIRAETLDSYQRPESLVALTDMPY